MRENQDFTRKREADEYDKLRLSIAPATRHMPLERGLFFNFAELPRRADGAKAGTKTSAVSSSGCTKKPGSRRPAACNRPCSTVAAAFLAISR
jgi:hypothetical protein